MLSPAGFCPQSRSNSCVAACCSMLLHRRGAPPGESLARTEERIHAAFSEYHPPTLMDAAGLIGATCAHAPDLDASFELLEAMVGQTWCAVVVMGGPWTAALRRYRRLREPFGILGADPEAAYPHHAVVLTEWEPSRISVYDRPARGNVRAIAPEASAVPPELWRRALLTVLAEPAADADAAVRAAAEWSQAQFGLEFQRLRAGGHIDTALRGALTELLASGEVIRDREGHVVAAVSQTE